MFIDQLKIYKAAKTLVRNSLKEFACEDLPLCDIRKFLNSNQFEVIAAEALEAVVARNPSAASPLLAAAMVVRIVHEILERWRKDTDEKKTTEESVPPILEATGA